MTSAAARREDLQLRLQELRDQRAREQAAFDAIAAAHPELPAAEIAALAQQQAQASAPQHLVVDGAEVRVGDRVTVKDDADLLRRADRGFFGPDVLKPIYLGEAAEVVRVLPDFQGKPALELRFADDVTKVFFVECVECGGSGEAATGARRTAAAGQSSRGTATDVPVFVPPSNAPPPPPKAEALPGWGQIVMPHRRPAGAQSAAAPRHAPPPPAAPPTASSRPAGPSATLQAAASPPAGAVAAVEPVTATGAASAAASRSPPPPHASTRPVERRESPSSPAAPPSPKAHRAAPGKEGAAAAPVPSPPAAPVAASPSDREAERPVHADPAVPAAAAVGDVPPSVSATSQPGPALGDDASRIPRRQSATAPTAGGSRACWVCGLAAADAELTAPTRVVFTAQCTAMFSLFAVLTRKLRWDAVQRTASRLFTEKGTEIKQASAVRDGMRLVVTAGCAYTPSAHMEAFASVPEERPAELGRAKAEATVAATAATSPAKAVATHTPSAAAKAVSKARTPSLKQSSTAAPATPAAVSPASPAKKSAASPASTPAGVAKPRHIRVYENGLYDDNIYRTVTIRPTYKTLVALKTTIGRELQWRDGKKVDLLFDACGAEIVDLDAIQDGDVVVASAGDRFAIPYPNTPMHAEAMKLSARLDPSRKC